MPPGIFSVISGSRPYSVGLLTHSMNVTTSIHWRKTTFTKSLGGGAWPPWPPGYATVVDLLTVIKYNHEAAIYVMFIVYITQMMHFMMMLSKRQAVLNLPLTTLT